MIFRFEDTAHVKKEEIESQSELLLEYNEKLNRVAQLNNYLYDESSINLPFDEIIVEKILKLKEKYTTPKLKYILDIGIGGSNLGTKAIYDALHGYYDLVEPERYPKMIFADTTDPSFIYKLYSFLKNNVKNPDEVVINAISKSGKTTETIANLEIITSGIDYARDRLVITTAYNSDLWRISKGLKIDCLPIPNKVGGRFSTFSSVGLFPLGCAGINILELLRGAMETRKYGLNRTVFKNPSMVSAIIQFSNYTKGKLINNNFFFHPQLNSLGDWYKQLMAESLGKDGKGITPTVSIGTTDLHSMLQLYLGGIKDKYFTFVNSKTYGKDIAIPKDPPVEILEEVEEKSAVEIMTAILRSVKVTFAQNGLPFTEIILDNISEYSLGEFMQFKMIEIMYLGKLMGVNTFDQPDVESYKEEAKKILAEE